MISSYLAMQNAILAKNMAVSNLMNTSDRMLSQISFGNTIPLRPSFSQAQNDELSMKANETKVSVLQKLIEAIEQKLGKKIKSSTPKYAGINYKA